VHLFRWYEHLHDSLPAIRDDARRAAQELGLRPSRGDIGLYAGSSAQPGPLPRYVLDAIVQANRDAIRPVRWLEDELRDLVKDCYGDGYDAAATNTCESAMLVTLETLCAPPLLRRGDAYRARLLAPYSDDLGYLVGYGRPFPPKYKNLMVDRTVSAGELGVEAKALTNLDAVLVRYEGASYQVHGIQQNPVPLLTRVDPERTAARFAEATPDTELASVARLAATGGP